VPEDVIASPYGVPRGSTEAIAHDVSSYDTLSNLEAICKLRATAAPKRSLVLISDPLHMARIWPQRWRIDCVDDSLLGYDTVAVAGGPVWKWYLASRDCLADAARLLLGEGFYLQRDPAVAVASRFVGRVGPSRFEIKNRAKACLVQSSIKEGITSTLSIGDGKQCMLPPLRLGC
jgi:hypothetical protein